MYHIEAMITVKTEPLAGKELTGQNMYRMVDMYFGDLGPALHNSFSTWFDFVKNIPYVSDIERFQNRLLEIVPRPKYLLDRAMFPKIDCKKKSILIGAWAKGNGVPFRFVAVSDRPDHEPTHVFPQVDFGAGWINADATLPEYRLDQGFPVTYATELLR